MRDINVSVIIPFYSNVKWLEEAIDSVLSQTYKDCEVIVINDGSKENLDSIVKKYSNDIVFINKENGGPASARNIGIEMAKGKYIAFLDSDDIWLENKLEVQVKYMEETGAIFSHTSYTTFGSDNTITSVASITSGKAYPSILAKCVIATPTVMIRADVLKSNSKFRFNKDMRYGQDYYLWIQIALEYDIHAINTPLCLVRMRGTNAAKRARVQLKVKAMILEYMKSDTHYRINTIPKTIQYAYELCNWSNSRIEKMEKYKINNYWIEIISKALYFPSWIVFKRLSNKI